MIYVGVDGGGTRTRAVVVDAEGRELARAEAPGAVASHVAPGRVIGAVTAAVHEACGAAGAGLPVERVWAGLAGAGQAISRAAVLNGFEESGLAREVVIGTDVEVAFASAFPEGPGVLLIAGTGSIAWARTSDGEVLRSGGWGQHLGDEGSGYALGRDGLVLVTRAHDGRVPPTLLSDVLLRACAVKRVDGLVGWMGEATKSEIAALAPLVVAAADEGDAGASELIDRSVRELAELVEPLRSAADRMVLWGGLVANDGPVGERVSAAMAARGWTVLDRAVDPPLGAAELARTGTPAHPVPD